MLEHFTNLGYTNAEPTFNPHSSNKHGFYKLQKKDTFYFAKYSKDNTVRQSSIATDIWWCQTIQKLQKTHHLGFQTPEIIEYGDDWYVAQWIEGHPSVKPTDHPSKLDQHLPTYAKCLAALNAIKPEWIDSPSPLEDDSTPFTQLNHRWQKWSERPLAEGLMTTLQLEQANSLVTDYQDYVTPHLQHGDFTPWHILIDAAQNWWLVDSEHATTTKPRYYDLAYLYSRIFTKLHSPSRATELLKAFIQEANVSAEELYPALLPVMTTRAIGLQFDALNDLHGDDYRLEAQDLLKRCLSRDPVRLLAG